MTQNEQSPKILVRKSKYSNSAEMDIYRARFARRLVNMPGVMSEVAPLIIGVYERGIPFWTIAIDSLYQKDRRFYPYPVFFWRTEENGNPKTEGYAPELLDGRDVLFIDEYLDGNDAYTLIRDAMNTSKEHQFKPKRFSLVTGDTQIAHKPVDIFRTQLLKKLYEPREKNVMEYDDFPNEAKEFSEWERHRIPDDIPVTVLEGSPRFAYVAMATAFRLMESGHPVEYRTEEDFRKDCYKEGVALRGRYALYFGDNEKEARILTERRDRIGITGIHVFRSGKE